MRPLSSSSSQQREPCLQNLISLCGPSLCRGMTLCSLLSTLHSPEIFPLKGVMKKLSELSTTSDSSMSLGTPISFHFSACFICSLGGRQEMPFESGGWSALQKFSFRCQQLMNLSASLALQVSLKSLVLCLISQQLWPKMMVGGLNSLHSSAIQSIRSLGLRLPSQKENSHSFISCLVSCGYFCIRNLQYLICQLLFSRYHQCCKLLHKCWSQTQEACTGGS